MTPATRMTVWHGTTDERDDLLKAIEHNCECQNEGGFTTRVCPAHDMLGREQRTLDRLLFARRIVARLRAEEFQTGIRPTSGQGH